MSAVVEMGVRALMELCGQPIHPGTEATPARVVAAYREMTRGYAEDPETLLSRRFSVEDGVSGVTYDELVVLRAVSFTSVCEHHLLPFSGTADVGYLPSEVVVGLSKLARLVDCFACRFQMQERMTSQIAHALVLHLGARAAGVVVRAEHSCMACRGIRKPGAEMVTSCLLGKLRDDHALRAEFLGLAR